MKFLAVRIEREKWKEKWFYMSFCGKKHYRVNQPVGSTTSKKALAWRVEKKRLHCRKYQNSLIIFPRRKLPQFPQQMALAASSFSNKHTVHWTVKVHFYFSLLTHQTLPKTIYVTVATITLYKWSKTCKVECQSNDFQFCHQISDTIS